MITVRSNHKRRESIVDHTPSPQMQVTRALFMVFSLMIYWWVCQVVGAMHGADLVAEPWPDLEVQGFRSWCQGQGAELGGSVGFLPVPAEPCAVQAA